MKNVRFDVKNNPRLSRLPNRFSRLQKHLSAVCVFKAADVTTEISRQLHRQTHTNTVEIKLLFVFIEVIKGSKVVHLHGRYGDNGPSTCPMSLVAAITII